MFIILIIENIYLTSCQKQLKPNKTNLCQYILVQGYSNFFVPRRFQNTVKPELTATSEQRPPVNNGRYNLVTASKNLTFIIATLSSGRFFRSRGLPLSTGLTVDSNFCNIKILKISVKSRK